ncbi:transcriptional regulator [Mycobacterium tuberculosis]|nr:transcriptional regulator [Mycobacterium tuberculosis]
MTDSLTEVPPAARRALLELANAPTVPVKVLITGGIGTGKTTVLAAARDTLRRSGLTVLACPPPDGEPPETALVIDDAQLLTDTELLRLTERVADSRLTVVAAAEAREHHRALRALTMALERDRPRISLGPLPVAEHLRDCTAGLPFLIHAVSARAQAPAQAAKVALIERLRRLDEPTLDTLLMMSLTHELGVSDVAAALGISVTDARGLVDRAHASGLIESSHTAAFLQSVHDAIAQIVGNAHHHEVETSLLRSQLDISPVSAELALRLAEHGLRDERLADILTRYAADTRDASVRCARLYRAAVHAGAKGLTVRLADALARTGDCTAAATLADDLLSSPDATERAAAVRVAASVAVHDGNTGHAAELFGWLGPHPDTMVSSAATIVFARTATWRRRVPPCDSRMPVHRRWQRVARATSPRGCC